MRRILAVVLVAALFVASAAPAAHAGGGHRVASGVIGLVALAIAAPFIIVGEVLALPYRAAAVVVAPPPVYPAPPPTYYAPAPAYYAPPAAYSPPPTAPPAYGAPAPTPTNVVKYPHGRHELHGDGVTTAYQWVWIPNPPPPPSPPAGRPAASR
jgi:hypothetical protein